MSEHDRTQLGAYALGALEPDEVHEVDEHLATCAECRAELAELEQVKDFLGEVPPEAFLDGPPDGGDLLLQRTLREVRELTPEPEAAQPVPAKRRSRWLMIAAAIVLVAGALAGGVAIGRSTAPEPAATVPVAGSKQVTVTDTGTGATMATTVEPRPGWSWVQVKINGLKAGYECEMIVTDKAGQTWTAGSWVVSAKAAREGSAFGGGVLVPLDQVRSVEIRTLQGEHVVTAKI